MAEEWAGLIGHLAACDWRHPRAASLLRHTEEGGADVLAQLERPSCLHCGKPIPAWRAKRKGSKFCTDRCGHDKAQKVYADLRWCDDCRGWHSGDCLTRERGAGAGGS
jgi:hypothetical protein